MQTQYASIDRQQPYAAQHDMTRKDMHVFVASNKQKVDLPVQREAFLERGLIEFTPQYAVNTFTRKEIYTGLGLAAENAQADGPSACSSLPTKPNKQGAGLLLVTTYTPTRGKSKGKKVNALFAGLAAHRRANKRRAAQAEREASVAAGTAFVVEGVVDSQGALRIYADEAKALKAALRHICAERKLGEWWQLPDKGASITPDAKALVRSL
jgi:hypothetical protein